MNLSYPQWMALFLAITIALVWAFYAYGAIRLQNLNTIQSLLLVIAIVSLCWKAKKEDFFFEVSPERQKCLIEQVAPIRGRSAGCCQVGYYGGSLPVLTEWTTPNNFSQDWKRTDNLTLNPKDPRLDLQIPPLELVPLREQKKRSQQELYTQQF